jgi:hypothetical protein
VCKRCNQRFFPNKRCLGQIEDFLRRKFEEHRCCTR